jgi:prepilin peptidase CpaA
MFLASSNGAPQRRAIAAPTRRIRPMGLVHSAWLGIAESLFLIAAWRDVASRLIPNPVCLALALGGLFVRLLDGPAALAVSALTALALFACLLVAWRFGLLGGGDVKLLAAAACGLPPASVADLLVLTALCGGALAFVHLALRRLPRPRAPSPDAFLLRRVCAAERWRILRHAPLPYGVAIACGGLWTMTKILGA